MTKKRLTPLERLNDPNEILKLFAWTELAWFVGILIGNWIKSLYSSESFFDLIPEYLLFGWVPAAIAIAIVGIILFKRAERKSARGQKE